MHVHDNDDKENDRMTATLSVTDHTGDTRIEWDKEDEASVAIAHASYLKAKEKGHMAYREGADGDRTQLHAFDPDAERIVMLPQLVGG